MQNQQASTGEGNAPIIQTNEKLTTISTIGSGSIEGNKGANPIVMTATIPNAPAAAPAVAAQYGVANVVEFINKEVEKMYIKETPKMINTDPMMTTNKTEMTMPMPKPLTEEEKKEQLAMKQLEYKQLLESQDSQVNSLRTELEKSKQDITTHTQLTSEAKALLARSTELAKTAKGKESKHAEERERCLDRERHFEIQRAEQHELAVAAENERAKAAAEHVIHSKEADYANKLISKHEMGVERAKAWSKKLELQLLEAELAKKRMAFELENIDSLLLSGDVQIPEAVEIEVGVKPIHLPEQRIESSLLSNVQPQNVIAVSSVKEGFEKVQKTKLEQIVEAEKILEETEQFEEEDEIIKKSKSILHEESGATMTKDKMQQHSGKKSGKKNKNAQKA